MLMWPLFFIFFSFAQELSVEELCFSSAQAKATGLKRVKDILLPSDKVTETSQCFMISTLDHRRELIQSFVRRIDPTVTISFSSAEIKQEPCLLKVEKIKSQRENKSNLTVGQNLSASNNGLLNESKELLQISTLKNFELTVNQDSIKGICRYINPTRYEITLEVVKEATPLLPPVPAGTIVVVVPDAQTKASQDTFKLQTQLQLNHGQRIEIGSVVKDLKNKAHQINSSPSVNVGRTTQFQVEKVFLSIE